MASLYPCQSNWHVPVFRRPTHAQEQRMLGRLGPRPVDPEIQLIGELSDGALGLAWPIEEGLRRQHPRHQQRRIDRRQLRISRAMSGARVEEMIKKPFVAHDPLRLRPLPSEPQEPQGRQRPLRRLGAGDPALLHPDRIGRQRKADRRDARQIRIGRSIGREAVPAGRRVPEECERVALQAQQELPLLCSELVGGRAAAQRPDRRAAARRPDPRDVEDGEDGEPNNEE